MELARATFPATNPFGVFAFGIGSHVRRGRPLATKVLNVYVERKTRSPAAAVPSIVLRRPKKPPFRVPTNVVATGRRPYAAAGSGSYSGLHPGAAISIRGSMPGRGAIAAILTTGGRATHALTAGHLFPSSATGTELAAAPDDGSAVRVVAKLAANFLDTHGVDCALLELTNAGSDIVNRAGPPLNDWLDASRVWSKLGCAFLATSNDYSQQTKTTDASMDALLFAPTRGNYWLRAGVATVGEITNPGDSGTVFSTGNSSQLAVGICAGAFGMHSIFEIFDRAMSLALSVNSSLTLY